MNIEQFIRDKARGIKNKKIILPEAEDKRIIEASKIITDNNIAEVILLDKAKLESVKIKEYAELFYQKRKAKGVTYKEAEKTMQSPLYYAAMMVNDGLADAFIAGASNTTPTVARAAIHCLGVNKKVNVISSCFIMQVPHSSYGEEGLFFFADCGIVPEPNSRQLSSIAISTADLARKVLGIEPRVAMLSFSSKGSSQHKSLDRIKQATQLAKAAVPDLIIDGELQADSAIVPQVAKIKNAHDILGGKANVLIFPDLNSGNIAYKLVQRLANARAIGPILQGLNKPCSDLSRGCSIEDIVDCAAVCAISA
ncbi:MAG TPA: phosphate acetyltransferase [Candidatus Omnitrophica bacterium]|nr:phosphate acetyltransferase [Candidatus Omnitrophota bacterium]